ncbi:hypothetical protein HB848_13735 [Listeria rocourtiae]|uniref:hypothetical protein n=1 Tax=Listeria rocourtiae TaxID=647910 RepID=UPI0016285F36|nr:hypothetical protein [Listeria rocourtiae]MBC1436397.1 hypothetical protein [Listeria rocourtiae]
MVSISLTDVHAEITDFKSDLVTDNMFLEEGISDSLFDFPKVTKPPTRLLRVALPVGPAISWKQVVATRYTNNVLSNKMDYYGRLALVGGMTATVGGRIANAFATGAVGAILGSMTARLSKYKAPNYWMVTKKYYAKDAINVYIKTSFQVYSNRARTKLAYSSFQINKYYSPK